MKKPNRTVIFNKDTLVFSGAMETILTERVMTTEFLTTPYGVFIPLSGLSLMLLRFLKHSAGEKTEERLSYLPPDNMFLTGILLSNQNELEEIILTDGGLKVIPLDCQSPQWSVYCDEVLHSTALTEMAREKKNLPEIIKFIDEFNYSRFVKPTTIDRNVWYEERQKQGFNLVLPSERFQRGIIKNYLD